MNGLKLVDMEAADMLDVIHYYAEQDFRYSTGEQAEAVSKSRTKLYEMYGIEYRYGTKESSSGTSYGGRVYITDESPSDSDLVPFDPANQKPKPFVKATEMNPDSSMPFGSILDAPLS